MPLLLINDVQRTVENISDNEWRVIRMLRLLHNGVSDDLQFSLCELIADQLTQIKAAADETEMDRSDRISDYPSDAIYQARPVGYNDFFDILIDYDRLYDMGTLELMIGSQATVNDAAGTLYFAYSDLVNADPAYSDFSGNYPGMDSANEAVEAFQGNMESVVYEWQRRFMIHLEKETADYREHVMQTPTSKGL